jgi:hypothetical protein
MPGKVGDLELDQDLEFQARSWRVQRAAWVVMALVLLGAVLGALGGGPLSRTTARSEDGSLVVEYERVIRQQAPAELKLGLKAGSDGLARVMLPRAYLEKVRVESIVPEPESSKAGPEGCTFAFRCGGDAEVIIRFDTEGLGPAAADVVLGRQGVAGQTARVRQFILP